MRAQVAKAEIGMAYLKVEGKAVHPDDTSAKLTPSQYQKQLKAYARETRDPAFAHVLRPAKKPMIQKRKGRRHHG